MWPGPLDSDEWAPMLTRPLLDDWSDCTAIDPPLHPDDVRGLEDVCGAHAPYVAHLQQEPDQPDRKDTWAWFCPAHAALIRADPDAGPYLVQLRTTSPGSAHRDPYRDYR